MIKDRLTVLAAMMEQGVIPVFYDPDVEVCKNVIQACANGGAKCIEFTNRGDFASHVFYEVTRHFAKADPSVIMGVGFGLNAFAGGVAVYALSVVIWTLGEMLQSPSNSALPFTSRVETTT